MTRYAVIERLPGHTLLRVTPLTGRQHQIRVHLAAIGHPVLGDLLYKDERLFLAALEPGAAPSARHWLHARRASFTHPVTGAQVVIEAPIPADLAAHRSKPGWREARRLRPAESRRISRRRTIRRRVSAASVASADFSRSVPGFVLSAWWSWVNESSSPSRRSRLPFIRGIVSASQPLNRSARIDVDASSSTWVKWGMQNPREAAEHGSELGILAPEVQHGEDVPLHVGAQETADEARVAPPATRREPRRPRRSFPPRPSAAFARASSAASISRSHLLEVRVHDEAEPQLVLPVVQLSIVGRAESRPVGLHAHVRLHDARMLERFQVGPLRVLLQVAERALASPRVRVVDLADLELRHDSRVPTSVPVCTISSRREPALRHRGRIEPGIPAA